MSCSKGAVLLMEEDACIAEYSKPLMLEAVLFCPILTWMSRQLLADGVQRFFVVCGPRFAEEARACLPEGVEAVVSEQIGDLMEFLDGSDTILVLSRAALPMAEAGEGFAYQASGRTLREAWQSGLTNNVAGAALVSGWLPVLGLETIAELELMLRDRIVKEHIKKGVRILDPASVYIDPRVEIGQGTTILPGTILQGAAKIGRRCQLGPQAVVNGCTLGDGVIVNASQINDSVLGDGCDVGPYAHIRPNCTVGAKCHIGAFVQLKNCVLGEGTKMSHLTYVGDADVGAGVNFGCGTVTSNYDGFKKYRCTIGDGAFIGCNTNLIAPVTVGEGSYIAAGSTITQEVPADALGVARQRQKNLEGWAARRRLLHEQSK